MKKERKEQNKEDIKKLVIARLKNLPSDRRISIGSKGDFAKEELIEHVHKEDGIGEKITEIQMEYLRLLKEGVFYEQNFSNNETKI